MKQIRFDFNNMFDQAVGKKHGVTMGDIRSMNGATSKSRETSKEGPCERIVEDQYRPGMDEAAAAE